MSILISLPCYGGLVNEKTTTSLFNLGKLLVRNNIDHGIITVANESLITHGRSRISNFFMNNTEFEYLFCLDADVAFQPEDMLKLYSYQKAIVSASYPMKTLPIRHCYELYNPVKLCGNLVKIGGIGMGFVLIHRSVFEKLNKHYSELKYFPGLNNSNYPITEREYHNSYHYFAEMNKEGKYLGEDMSFFHRVSDIGYDVWMDTSIELQHIGSHVFGK
jgi:hypothetical protein